MFNWNYIPDLRSTWKVLYWTNKVFITRVLLNGALLQLRCRLSPLKMPPCWLSITGSDFSLPKNKFFVSNNFKKSKLCKFYVFDRKFENYRFIRVAFENWIRLKETKVKYLFWSLILIFSFFNFNLHF